MFISKARYKYLVESRDAWEDLAIRVQNENESVLQTAKGVHRTNKTLLELNKDLLELVDKLTAEKAEVAKEIFAEIEKCLVHFPDEDGDGELAFYAQEFYELKKNYIGE